MNYRLQHICLGGVGWVMLTIVACVGCGKTDPPRFHVNLIKMRQADVVEKNHQQDVAVALEALFGTPDDPFVIDESGLNATKVQLAAGPTGSDASGKQRGLYRQHCVHCHGVSGDGMGPTAAILNPYPRDYRLGIYKFKSTERPERPTDEDLERVIREGVVGTAMPSFDLLPPDEVAALVEYVKYLSIRGETEIRLINMINELGENERLKLDHDTLVGEVSAVAQSWSQAKDKVILPVDRPDADPSLTAEARAKIIEASIAKGRELFYGKAECRKCHGDSALGDGQADDYDEWSKPVALALKEIDEQMSKFHGPVQGDEYAKLAERREWLEWALPPRNMIPRNLRLGIYRGGRRPIDLYRRVHAGINGAPMPANGDNLLTDEEKQLSPDEQAKIKGQKIWNLVDYVRSLPYEAISRPPRDHVMASTPN